MKPDGTNVLLVEDNPGDAALVMNWLAGPGMHVDHVGMLDDASARAREIDYDAVLLDLSLPDSRGLDTVTRFREHDDQSAIVVVTGAEDPKLGFEAVHQGAQEYLSKGDLDARSLRAAIERAIVRQTLFVGYNRLLVHARVRLARLEGVLSAHPNPIFVVDADDEILFANNAAELLTGRHVGAPLPEHLAGRWEGWRGIVDLGEPVGEIRVADACVVPVQWLDGQDCRMFIVAPRDDDMRHALAQPLQSNALMAASAEAICWRLERIIDLLSEKTESPGPRADALSYALQAQYFVNQLLQLGKRVEGAA